MFKKFSMNSISIVIITKNEEHVLERTLMSLQGVSDDLIIVDSGSDDRTLEIAKNYGAKIFQTEWLGYGTTKNVGISNARYDWILTLDADEAIDETLKNQILSIELNKENIVYEAWFKNFIGNRYLKYGGYLKRKAIVLFNKRHIKWDDQPVHEKLLISNGFNAKKLQGYVLHYTLRDIADFNSKMTQYAFLNAQKYFQQGKKVTALKLFFIRSYTFFRNYFLGLGFLDGTIGFISASIYSHYTFLKYARLRELVNAKK